MTNARARQEFKTLLIGAASKTQMSQRTVKRDGMR
jgi:hypothetical protein